MRIGDVAYIRTVMPLYFRQAAAVLKRYSWERCGRETLEVLERVGS